MEVQRPFGEITRGTTNPNRLRRADRWLLATQAARLRGTAARPALVVDLGYGASPVTTIELAERLAAHARTRRGASSGGIEVIGLEIDPERVRRARLAAERRQAVVGDSSAVPVTFGLGGFETPTPNGRPATVIRAFNVLRQYDESEVPASWEAMQARLTGTGIIIDGTCNELGRRMTWVTLDADGPKSLTVSVAFGAIEAPSDVAERLPKALIHHNVPGEPIHTFLTDWDHTWARNGHLGAFGRRQRFIASVRDLKSRGWPILDSPARWRVGEVTVAWAAVAPRTGPA